MREIKFRAWDKDAGKYADGIEGLYVDILEVGTGTYRIEQMCPGRYIIEQYTGLKDKNGKEIYEGDIMENGARTSEVTWHDWLSVFCFDGEPIYQAATINENRSLPNWVVIGNIHENPELLEKEKGE